MPEDALAVTITTLALNLTGFETDLANELGKRMGYSSVSWVSLPFDRIFQANHTAFDMALQVTTITPERERIVDFSIPYLDVNQGLFVRAGSDIARARSVADLKPYRFGAHDTTTGWRCIEDVIRPDRPLTRFSNTFEAAQAVVNGLTDAAVTDVPVVIALSKQLRGTAVVGQFVTNERYGVVFDKGSPLVGRVNQAITGMKGDGTLQRLRDRWFPGWADLPVLR